jgi:hypothetical protein
MPDHTEVTPWPSKGQFWASLEPLMLLQVTEEVLAEDNCICFRRWLPPAFEVGGQNADMVVIGPPLASDHFRYLWHDIYMQWEGTKGARQLRLSHTSIELPSKPLPGTAFIDALTERVFFIGPPDEAKEGVVRVLADWAVGIKMAAEQLLIQPYPLMTPPEPPMTGRYNVLKGKDLV